MSPHSRQVIIVRNRAHRATSALRASNRSYTHDCTLEAMRTQGPPAEARRIMTAGDRFANCLIESLRARPARQQKVAAQLRRAMRDE